MGRSYQNIFDYSSLRDLINLTLQFEVSVFLLFCRSKLCSNLSNCSLNMENHLYAFSSKEFSREISLSLASSS